jgi:phosphopantothenoylcysteine decarboxylase/phosphopantothenate--cysteine ligase
VRVVEPDAGYLACGMTGPGRMAEVESIAQAACDILGIRHDFDGQTVLVTAGPTREDLDPVRFLTNRSSGRMGYAVADAAARRGARVILVTGPVELPPPAEAEVVAVRTADEMRRAVLDRGREAGIVVMAAAVADYRPAAPSPQKLKRGEGRVSLELEPTADILAELGRQKGDRILVGFAAETQDADLRALEKLRAKNADIMVANDVTREGAGFDSDTNIVNIFSRDGNEIELGRMSKFDVANQILDEVLRLRRAPK